MILGILAAVYLYNVERRSEPHADVSQSVQLVRLPQEDAIAIEAYIVVKNLGTQLLNITHIHSRVEAFDLKAIGLTELLDLRGEAYQNAVVNSGSQQKRAFQGTELDWPQLKVFDRNISHQIEPGESDLITATFVLRCPIVRYVRVATDITKPTTDVIDRLFGKSESTAGNIDEHGEQHTMLWKTRSMIDLKPVCGE